MQNYHTNVFYSKDDGGCIADIPDLKFCSAFGKTPGDALEGVLRAKDAWLAAARDAGKPILRPATVVPYTECLNIKSKQNSHEKDHAQ